MKKNILGTTTALLLLALIAPAVRADVIYTVSISTSGLGAGSILDFQMNDFANPGDGNNTATISNLNLNGGSLGGLNPEGLPPGSDVSGSLGSTLSITDGPGIFGSGFNDFNQAFNPGSSLTFTLTLTTNVSAAEMGTPDQFSFTVYNAALNSESVLLFNITGTSLTPINGTAAGSTPGAPLINATPAAAVPEPNTLSLIASMLATLAIGYAWQRRQHAATV